MQWRGTKEGDIAAAVKADEGEGRAGMDDGVTANLNVGGTGFLK